VNRLRFTTAWVRVVLVIAVAAAGVHAAETHVSYAKLRLPLDGQRILALRRPLGGYQL